MLIDAYTGLLPDTRPNLFGRSRNTLIICYLGSKHAQQKSNKCLKWPFYLQQISNNKER